MILIKEARLHHTSRQGGLFVLRHGANLVWRKGHDPFLTTTKAPIVRSVRCTTAVFA